MAVTASLTASFEDAAMHNGTYVPDESARADWEAFGADAFRYGAAAEGLKSGAASGQSGQAVTAQADGRLSADEKEKKEREGRAYVQQVLTAQQQQLIDDLDDTLDELQAVRNQINANERVIALAKTGKLDRDNPDHTQLIIAAGLDPNDDDAAIIKDGERQLPSLREKEAEIADKADRLDDALTESGLDKNDDRRPNVDAIKGVIHEQSAVDVASDIEWEARKAADKAGLKQAGEEVHEANEQESRAQASSFNFGGMG